jgi:hypothetical protein
VPLSQLKNSRYPGILVVVIIVVVAVGARDTASKG